jgi:hypothetical protein
MGPEIDAIRGHHIKGSMSEVDDAGYAIDQGKTNGQKSVYTATDQTVDKDINYHIASAGGVFPPLLAQETGRGGTPQKDALFLVFLYDPGRYLVGNNTLVGDFGGVFTGLPLVGPDAH